MLSVAFKEWAVVCKAISEGQQQIILRKGGIAEDNGLYRPEHRRFWLYPTYFHERQQDALRPEAIALLDQVEAERPPEGILRIETFVVVEQIEYVTELDRLLALQDFHIGTEEMLRTRFYYRRPGVYLHWIRTYKLPEPALIPEDPGYAGCKTWVELETPILTESAVPIDSEEEFAQRTARFQQRLRHVVPANPTTSSRSRRD